MSLFGRQLSDEIAEVGMEEGITKYKGRVSYLI
jgi:hypothetical protein